MPPHQEAKAHGCRNVLALRGDPPAGKEEWEAVEGGFLHSIDLVRHIRKHYGNYFDIAVAGFPHFHHLLPAERDLEMKYLKEKIDAGVNFIFTQMFYDIEIFIDWVKAVRAAGITILIVPGIAPIQIWNSFIRTTSLAKAVIPQSFSDALEPYKNDDEKVRAIGTKLVADMCRKILKADLGIRGLHFYTMDLEKATKMRLYDPSSGQTGQNHTSRTESLDEYPNGRFGDSRSPAYDELDGYGVWIKQTKEDVIKLWGHPTTFFDIAPLFSRFCMQGLAALPWSDQAPSKGTSVISTQLAQMNELGFLTINSQPAVNGARSDDKIHGWGPSNGFVYQKAYLEFFVNPTLLGLLLKHIARDSNITYYVINNRGDLRTNTHSDGPNAVTWGVFPGKEIVQPTIDEAYELGQQWAQIYDADSPSRKLITDLMENSSLVNVVHNDFQDPEAIFKPFFLAGEEYAALNAASPTMNGINGH
ncbi:hypothetical protein DXG01_001106 [Tephrocybe rancida]|nr:hypothetical protein DXG01_001106 [Tephrocybe rancida]